MTTVLDSAGLDICVTHGKTGSTEVTGLLELLFLITSMAVIGSEKADPPNLLLDGWAGF